MDAGDDTGHGLAAPEMSSVETDLSLATSIARLEHQLRDGGNCYSCGEMSRVPVVTPCLCLLCSDCVSKSRSGGGDQHLSIGEPILKQLFLLVSFPCRERCVQCNTAYNMEPGEYDPSKLVPYELIELQPSYRSDSRWRADWEKTVSSKVWVFGPPFLKKN